MTRELDAKIAEPTISMPLEMAKDTSEVLWRCLQEGVIGGSLTMKFREYVAELDRLIREAEKPRITQVFDIGDSVMTITESDDDPWGEEDD